MGPNNVEHLYSVIVQTEPGDSDRVAGVFRNLRDAVAMLESDHLGADWSYASVMFRGAEVRGRYRAYPPAPPPSEPEALALHRNKLKDLFRCSDEDVERHIETQRDIYRRYELRTRPLKLDLVRGVDRQEPDEPGRGPEGQLSEPDA